MSVTLSELLRWGKERLSSANIEDYGISAEMLLRAVLDLSRSQLLLSRDREISSEIKSEYEKLISRRINREPLQYIVGWVDFYNVILKSDSRALIPRPETEILVDTVLRVIRGLSAPSILDIGTGSGNIAVALARNAPGSHITGVDINREALQLAAFNSEHNSLAAQIKLVEGDILDNDFVKSLGLFDLVVSNPPYVAADEGHKLQPEITMFEPASALFCGQDPLKFFKTIIGCISYILKAGGYLAFEAGFGQPEQIVEFMKQDFKNIEIVEDLAGLERVVVGTYARSNKG